MRKNQKFVLLRSKAHLLAVVVLLSFSIYSLSLLKDLHTIKFALESNYVPTIRDNNYGERRSTTSMRTVTTHPYKRVTKSMSELPKVPVANEHTLFFNIIPHTGSEMLVLLLQWLQGWNGFRHVRLKNKSKGRYTWNQQENLINKAIDIMKSKAVPLSFEQREMYFIDFSSFGYQSPTYINIVRDPFDKFITMYKRELNHSPPSIQSEKFINLNEVLDKCLQTKKVNCSYGNGNLFDLTIPYFCGQHSDCTLINNRWALEQAKLNVEKYYSVVGILEETNSTLEVLENKLPFFFKGVQDKYYKQILLKNNNIALKKQKQSSTSDKARKYFQKRFKLEYEFYYWLRKRLFNQLQMFSSHSHI